MNKKKGKTKAGGPKVQRLSPFLHLTKIHARLEILKKSAHFRDIEESERYADLVKRFIFGL